MRNFIILATLGVIMASICFIARANAKTSEPMGKPPANAQEVVLAGGCFWGVQAVFEHTKGVFSATSGYAGGKAESAQYETVSSGTTGHAEAVKIVYDPAKISLSQLLDVYFIVAHNPTQLNYQGPDHGTQYRSTVFYASDAQKQEVERKIATLKESQAFSDPIVTTLEPLKAFYPAEDYHQHYAALHPMSPYILIHDAPKVKNLKSEYPNLYKE